MFTSQGHANASNWVTSKICCVILPYFFSKCPSSLEACSRQMKIIENKTLGHMSVQSKFHCPSTSASQMITWKPFPIVHLVKQLKQLSLLYKTFCSKSIWNILYKYSDQLIIYQNTDGEIMALNYIHIADYFKKELKYMKLLQLFWNLMSFQDISQL